MTDKRQWTGGKLVCEALMGGVWIVRPKQNPNPKNPNAVIRSIGTFYHEADARLFAAADGLYDMLQDYVCQHGCDCGHPSCSECKRTREARERLRAANPDAFQEGDND